MSELIANLVDVGHQFEEGPEVFKRVTFSIEKGSFHFLTGPSGSGKSSLLRILHLDLKPKWGSLHLFGQDMLLVKTHGIAPLRQRVGVVFQEFKLLYHLDVINNVSLPLLIRGVSEKNSHKQAKELLDWVGLGDSLTAHPATLSGGQKQRVAIARAVITKPDLLLADEPTGNVDDEMAMKLLMLFEELNKEGTAVLIATHNQRLLERTQYPQYHLHEGSLKKVTKK